MVNILLIEKNWKDLPLKQRVSICNAKSRILVLNKNELVSKQKDTHSIVQLGSIRFFIYCFSFFLPIVSNFRFIRLIPLNKNKFSHMINQAFFNFQSKLVIDSKNVTN